MQHLLIPKLDTHWTGFQTNAALSIPSVEQKQRKKHQHCTALPPSQARRQQASLGRLPTALTAQPAQPLASVDKRPALAGLLMATCQRPHTAL